MYDVELNNGYMMICELNLQERINGKYLWRGTYWSPDELMHQDLSPFGGALVLGLVLMCFPEARRSLRGTGIGTLCCWCFSVSGMGGGGEELDFRGVLPEGGLGVVGQREVQIIVWRPGKNHINICYSHASLPLTIWRGFEAGGAEQMVWIL